MANGLGEVTIIKVPYILDWQIARKSNSLYSPLITIPSIKFGWNWIKLWEQLLFESFNSNFAEYTE